MGHLACVLLAAYSLCISSAVKGSREITRNINATFDTKDVEEGGNLTVTCNVTVTHKGRVYWTHDGAVFEKNKTLNIHNITRNLRGFYTCTANNYSYTEVRDKPSLQDDIYTFYLNALYPAKILSVNSTATKLRQHDDFRMRVKVEGNPLPTTTFKSLFDGRTWFRQNESEGPFDIMIPSMNCTDTGQYDLMCYNDLASVSLRENITVLCPPQPDPNFPLNKTAKPRIGDNVKFTVHVDSYTVPSYRWSHNGTQLSNHTDTENTTVLTLNRIAADDFGQYELVMANEGGNYSIQFHIQADGPPEPVSNLSVSGINETCAHLSFTTGYNYNSTQTFIIDRYKDGNITELKNCTDLTSGRGGDPFTCILCKLEQDTVYNVSVVSRNSRGDSTSMADDIAFSTYGKPKPDPVRPTNSTFKPRLGETVTLSIHAVGYPVPKYQWLHNGVHINSTDIGFTSEVHIGKVTVKEFGKYTLSMKNAVGNFTKVYEILADGPPEPVSNLSVSGINETCAHLNFTTGYNYNSTQTFIIDRYKDGKITELKNCTDLTTGRGGDPFTCILCKLEQDTVYNVSIVSRNSRGESPSMADDVAFSTYGKPKPDPGRPTNSTFKPRLGEIITLSIHAVGHPVPKYQWLHNGVHINSTDTDFTSEVHIGKVTVKDFGKYTLIMKNDVGNFTKVYEILADGPPDPVTHLNFSDVTQSSANISFITGYDYNKTQTFLVMQSQNGKMTELENVTDKSPDPGEKTFGISVMTLTSNTVYNVTVLSRNRNGTSPSSSEFITFTTEGKPSPDPAHHVNTSATPRLGRDATFTMYAVGNPSPVFSWWHNNVPLKHTDDGLTTNITIHNVTQADFGDYVLNMKNELGNNNYTFHLKEDGPPDAVTKLNATHITSDTVVLRWKAGFDYGSKQSFEVRGTVNDKAFIDKEPIADSTGGKGGMETFKLRNLESSSTYNIYLVAKNYKGEALKSNDISFTTEAGHGKSKTTAAEYVGYVAAGLGGVVLIIVIITVIRRYRRAGNEVPYQEINEEEHEENLQRQPHHYRYDDAAAPSGL